MNIIVITFYTSNYVIGKDTEKINQSYCEFNNYDFNCYNIIPQDGLTVTLDPEYKIINGVITYEF